MVRWEESPLDVRSPQRYGEGGEMGRDAGGGEGREGSGRGVEGPMWSQVEGGGEGRELKEGGGKGEVEGRGS